MGQNSRLVMGDFVPIQAAACIEDMRLNVRAAEFGYKVQALAAHVLLRLSFQIHAINQSGHPDIVATRGTEQYHFEIEAEVGRPRLRRLKEEDFASLVGVPGVLGYFALAIGFPTPRWVLVPAERLQSRNPSPNVLLESLSDKDFSHAWTMEYQGLLSKECRRILESSFATLCERALPGNGL